MADVLFWKENEVCRGVRDLQLPQESRELIVCGVSGTYGLDMATQAFSYESHVADNIEELMACRFVGPCERPAVDVSQLCGVASFYTESVGKLVEVLLRHLTLVDYYGVVEVAALDESHLQERGDVADKHESASARHLFCEVVEAR